LPLILPGLLFVFFFVKIVCAPVFVREQLLEELELSHLLVFLGFGQFEPLLCISLSSPSKVFGQLHWVFYSVIKLNLHVVRHVPHGHELAIRVYCHHPIGFLVVRLVFELADTYKCSFGNLYRILLLLLLALNRLGRRRVT